MIRIPSLNHQNSMERKAVFFFAWLTWGRVWPKRAKGWEKVSNPHHEEDLGCFSRLHPWKPTWNPKWSLNEGLEDEPPFQSGDFQFPSYFFLVFGAVTSKTAKASTVIRHKTYTHTSNDSLASWDWCVTISSILPCVFFSAKWRWSFQRGHL